MCRRTMFHCALAIVAATAVIATAADGLAAAHRSDELNTRWANVAKEIDAVIVEYAALQANAQRAIAHADEMNTAMDTEAADVQAASNAAAAAHTREGDAVVALAQKDSTLEIIMQALPWADAIACTSQLIESYHSSQDADRLRVQATSAVDSGLRDELNRQAAERDTQAAGSAERALADCMTALASVTVPGFVIQCLKKVVKLGARFIRWLFGTGPRVDELSETVRRVRLHRAELEDDLVQAATHLTRLRTAAADAIAQRDRAVSRVEPVRERLTKLSAEAEIVRSGLSRERASVAGEIVFELVFTR